ncbi:MAG TPA: hypothetical protein VF767_01265 [Bryobacteraceae bacterium]
MAKLSDLKLNYQVFMKAYPYRKLDWRPGACLSKPLGEARIALVPPQAFSSRTNFHSTLPFTEGTFPTACSPVIST